MRYAIISDIHANIDALRCTLGAIASHGHAGKILCLGDVVGFHTAPAECIDLLQECDAESLCGNHDAGVVGALNTSAFPKECWEAIEWTRGQIDGDHVDYLTQLPVQTVVGGRLWMMHGFFGNVNRYMTGRTRLRAAVVRLWLGGCRMGLYGHTHRPSCFRVRLPSFEVVEEETTGAVELREDAFYLINPGTVGQPRTGVEEARYCILDEEQRSVSFERVSYDYANVLQRTLSVFPRHAKMYERFRTALQDREQGVKRLRRSSLVSRS